MDYNTSHLVALMQRLANETARHSDNPAMAVYIDGIRKEIKSEEAFLAARGVNTYAADVEMTYEEILAELGL
jgi:hypothetical protein